MAAPTNAPKAGTYTYKQIRDFLNTLPRPSRASQAAAAAAANPTKKATGTDALTIKEGNERFKLKLGQETMANKLKPRPVATKFINKSPFSIDPRARLAAQQLRKLRASKEGSAIFDYLKRTHRVANNMSALQYYSYLTDHWFSQQGRSRDELLSRVDTEANLEQRYAPTEETQAKPEQSTAEADRGKSQPDKVQDKPKPHYGGSAKTPTAEEKPTEEAAKETTAEGTPPTAEEKPGTAPTPPQSETPSSQPAIPPTQVVAAPSSPASRYESAAPLKHPNPLGIAEPPRRTPDPLFQRERPSPGSNAAPIRYQMSQAAQDFSVAPTPAARGSFRVSSPNAAAPNSPGSRSVVTPPSSGAPTPASRGSSSSPPNPPQPRGSNSVPRFSNPAKKADDALRRGVKLVANPGLKAKLVIIGIMAIFTLFLVGFQTFDQTLRATALLNASVTCSNSTGGAGCPDQAVIDANKASPEACKFLNPAIPLHYVEIPKASLDAYFTKYGNVFIEHAGGGSSAQAEYDRRLKLILDKSKEADLNPALLLGLWKSENNFAIGERYHMGCLAGGQSFDAQVYCALGYNESGTGPGGALSSKCIRQVPGACEELRGIRENPTRQRNKAGELQYQSNKDLYANYPITYPIVTFDDWEESFGPHSPQLNWFGSGRDSNQNCTNSYNLHIEVAEILGVCGGGSPSSTAILGGGGSGDISSCKFYRTDQTDASICPPSSEGYRCAQGLDFKSPKLISYIQKVAADTGVPAPLLGAIVRVEATVPNHDFADKSNWVQRGSSISDFTDSDINYVEQNLDKITSDQAAIDTYIPGTSKAVCPASKSGPALGIMQMEHNFLQTGVNFINKNRGMNLSASSLRTRDFCDPLNSLYLGAGLIIEKLGSNWDASKIKDKAYISTLVHNYFGSEDPFYIDSVYQSVTSCQAGSGGGPQPVTIIGDSLSVGATPFYKQLMAQVSIDADVGRQWSTGQSKLDDLKTQNKINPVLVFELGTNGKISEAEAEKVISTAGTSKVVFMSIFGTSWDSDVNTVLNSVAAKHSGQVVVANWNKLASEHSEWFKSDKVHPLDGDGYQQLAQLIASAVTTIAPPSTNATLAAQAAGSCYCSVPTKSLGQNAVFSCPVPNGTITCASYGKPEPWGGMGGNSCRVDSTGNGGHCNKNYINNVEICTEPIRGGNLIRTAKSIDITAAGGNRAGDPVYLPEINGQKVHWYYKGVVDAGHGFGWINLFQSEPTDQGIWSLHFVHANNDSPHLIEGQELTSGDVGATMFNLGSGIHIHATVGLNVGDSKADLKNYDPGWKFADRDLGMCTGQAPTNTAPVAPAANSSGGKIVALTAGHAVQGNDNHPGYRGSPADKAPDGVAEGIRALNLVKKIKERLESNGYTVVMTHEGSPLVDIPSGTSGPQIDGKYRYFDYQKRIDKSNESNADLYVEIHFNSVIDNPTYFYDNRSTDPNWTKASKEAGLAITQSLYKKLNLSGAPQSIDDTGCYGGGCGGHFYTIGPKGAHADPDGTNPNSIILRELKAPEAYIETLGNMDPRASNLDVLADAYAEGIIKYLGGSTYVPSVNTSPTTGADGTSQSCAQTTPVNKLTYYCQSKESHMFAGERMSQSGCGPTSMAMILSAFGQTLSPVQVADIFMSHGFYVNGQGSNIYKLVQDEQWLHSLGLEAGVDIKTSTGGIDLNQADAAIKAHQLIIASSSNYPTCNGCPHIVVIDGVDLATKQVHVQDPICSAKEVHDQPAQPPSGPGGWSWKYAFPIGPNKPTTTLDDTQKATGFTP